MSKELWGAGGVYLRKRTWWIQYHANGKLHRELAHTTDERKAQRFLDARRSEARDGKGIIAPKRSEKITIRDLAEGIRLSYRNKRNRSTARLEQAIGFWFEIFGEGERAANLNFMLDNYVDQRRKMLITRKGVRVETSDATIHNELALLRCAVNIKVPVWLSHNHKLKLPKLAQSQARTGFLKPGEFVALRGELPAYLRDPVSFMYESGWRKQEVLKLEWRDVALKRDAKTGEVIGGTITLRPENDKTSKHGPRKPLELFGKLIEIIARALPTEHEPDPHERVFLREGEPIADFRKAWRSACKKIKRPELLIHDMRRSAVRNLVRAGISEHVAMEFSGHTTRSIFDRYDCGSTEDMVDAGAKLTAYLRAQEQVPVAI